MTNFFFPCIPNVNFSFPAYGIPLNTHTNIYRPTTSMFVLSWLFRKSMITVILMAIVKNLNCRQRNIHILKCSVPKLFWNLKHYKWSHKRFKNWYFASSEGLCADLLEALQSLCSILEATSRSHRLQSENPSSVTIEHCHIKCSNYKVL